MSIMRSSLKQHVGLLPDDVSRGPKLSKSSFCVASLDSAQPLSSYYIDALASRLNPHHRTSAVTSPRQLAPTMGLAHGGVEFLEGALQGSRSLRFVEQRGTGLEGSISSPKQAAGMM